MSEKLRLYNIIMVLSFFALWLSIQIPEDLEVAIGYFLILTIGVGHGANDLKIYFNSRKLSLKKTIVFVTIYALIVLIGFALFFFVPEIILTVFLLISGYHFGQEHFEKYKLNTSWLTHVFLLSYGFSIILTLLVLHHEESLPIINDLLNVSVSYTFLLYPLIASVALLALSSLKVMQPLMWKTIARELFYLVLIYVLFQSASLLWGFAIYFILWHSVPSIHSQIVFLEGTVSNFSVKKYILNSLLYWIAALIFLSLLYYFLKEYTSLFLSTIIAFLGGITFPHVIVMNQLHKK
ncbi:MAG: Brp/Blh family beta-carotene 15,15'-monooxygenase [Nonlabens sp.]|jgi:Brp/Blh family beta-carotene 15,15'-monooxygenase|uniref:Brp/Blh family beta-carotene 15,15'-dioxygenase n=1 Tax=Nonlabens sp. TaxID=1888209 RepID=UPI0039E5A64D